MTRKTTLIAILAAALAGLVIRLYQVGSMPPFLSNDEVSIAYDAYSLARTGRDEHHHPWPVSFESLGTFKAPLYGYLLAPLTLVLPNSDLTAKLPSLTAGVLTIIIIGLLAIEVTGKNEVGAFAAWILAVSPGHIHTSRMVSESNVAFFFLILGLYLFISGVNYSRRKKTKMLLSVIPLIASMYGYHTEWGLVPMLILLLTATYFGKKKIKSGLFFVGAGIVLALPLIFDYLDRLGTSARANSEMLWREGRIIKLIDSQKFLGAKLLVVIKVFLSNYLSYLNPDYLFFGGLRLLPGEHPYQIGLFLMPLIIALIAGFISLKKNLKKQHFYFFIGWLALSPVVPALTQGGYNLMRNLVSLAPLSIVTAVGLFELWQNRRRIAIGVIAFCGLFLLFDSIIYLHHYPIELAASYQGYEPVARYLKPMIDQGVIVKIDNRFGLSNEHVGVPYLYFAYYEKWDPAILQNRVVTKEGTVYKNFISATQIDWQKEKIVPGRIYVIPCANPPSPAVKSKLRLIQSFTDLSGRGSFEVWRAI